MLIHDPITYILLGIMGICAVMALKSQSKEKHNDDSKD